MQVIAPLRNPIRHYAWGSKTALAELMGRPSPAAEPEAELWMGAHPSAPSQVLVKGRWRSLLEVIDEDPKSVLGERVVERFGPRLPFLFKVLAVERPLSIQAHPDAAQAREGFERENAAGIPLDAPQRNYRDASHKPELVCAVGPFSLLCGFRTPQEIATLLGRLGAPGLLSELVPSAAELDEPELLRTFLTGLAGMEPAEARRVALVVARAAARQREAHPAFDWVVRLHEEHPEDPGALAPVFLRFVRLEAGESMLMPPGELHGYLGGVGIELMANSDNVLRLGLTAKHTDIPELLRVLRFRASRGEPVHPRPIGPGEAICAAVGDEIQLSTIRVRPGTAHRSPVERSVEILLCSEGEVQVGIARDTGLALRRGASCLVPAAAGCYSIRGAGALYRAAVPS